MTPPPLGCKLLRYIYIYTFLHTVSLRPSNSRSTRSLSNISLDELPSSGRRIKALSDDQKLAIQQLQHASQMPYKERKRQFSALKRRLEKPCPPGVLAKWEAATNDQAKSLVSKYICISFLSIRQQCYQFTDSY